MADINPSPLALQFLNRYGLGVDLPRTFQNLEVRQPMVTTHPDATAQALGQPERVTAQEIQANQGESNRMYIGGTPEQMAQPGNVPSASTMMPNAVAVQQGQPQQPQAPAPYIHQLLTQLLGEKPANDLMQQMIGSIGPSKLVGKDYFGFGRGGIMGTGVEPIDVLAFALGGLLTSRLPQADAINATMQIAQLPGKFRQNQQDAANKFIGNTIGLANAGTGMQNAQMSQLQHLLALKKAQDALSFTNSLTERLSTGVPLTETEQKLYAVRAHSAGMDAATTKELLLTPNITEQLARLKVLQQELGQGMKFELDLPGVGKATVGGDTQRAPNTIDANAQAMYGRKFSELPQGGIEQQKVMEKVNAIAQARVDISQGNLNVRKQELSILRPEERKELGGLREMYIGTTDMLKKYEASLASHGGTLTPDVNVALQAATTSPDGFIGKSIQYLGQRYPKLTSADLEFVARYATMQKFARGALNDVGNLSNFERGIFTTMIGTPLDNPALFRARAANVLSDAERGFTTAKSTLVGTRNLGEYENLLPQKSSGSSGSTTPPPGAVIRDYRSFGK